jgi:hypothetical protein
VDPEPYWSAYLRAVLARGADSTRPQGGSTPPDPPGRPPHEGLAR